MTNNNSENKIKVRGILICKNGGSMCGGYDVVLGTWEETDAVLKLWAKKAPAGGYFEECHFKVLFVDCNSYSGTYHLKQEDAFGKNLLAAHVLRVCEETKIAWDAEAFLCKYDIPKAA